MSALLHDSPFSDSVDEAAADLTLEMLHADRHELMTVGVGPLPIVYALFIAEPLYLDGRWAYYVGHTSNGRRRVTNHRETFRDATGIGPGTVRIAWMYAASRAIASWAELTLIDHLAPVGNVILPGSGCKSRGAIRESGEASKFRTMHPHAGQSFDSAAQTELRSKVVTHLNRTAPPKWVLDAFDR